MFKCRHHRYWSPISWNFIAKFCTWSWYPIICFTASVFSNLIMTWKSCTDHIGWSGCFHSPSNNLFASESPAGVTSYWKWTALQNWKLLQQQLSVGQLWISILGIKFTSSPNLRGLTPSTDWRSTSPFLIPCPTWMKRQWKMSTLKPLSRTAMRHRISFLRKLQVVRLPNLRRTLQPIKRPDLMTVSVPGKSKCLPVWKNMAAMSWFFHDLTMIMAQHGRDHIMIMVWWP